MNIENKSQTIKLLTTPGLGDLWIVDALEEYFKTSDRRFLIELCDNTEFSSNYDIVIGADKGEDPGFESHIVTEYEMCLYGSPFYLGEHGEMLKPADGENHRMIMYPKGSIQPYPAINWFLDIPDFKMGEPFIEVNSGYSILQCIQNGIGIGSISTLAARSSPIPLKRVLPAYSYFLTVYFYINTIRGNKRECLQIFKALMKRLNLH